MIGELNKSSPFFDNRNVYFKKKKYMITEIITHFLETARKHKAVNYADYKRVWNINDQHNHRYYQFIIDDENRLDSVSVANGIMSFNMSAIILGFVHDDESVLKVQENALHIGLDWIHQVADSREIELIVQGYSFLAFSEYTDDNCSGVKMDIQFIVPAPINLCEYRDNFIEKPQEDDENNLDLTSDLPTKQDKPLDLKPLRF
jgi:hypothetical protein